MGIVVSFPPCACSPLSVVGGFGVAGMEGDGA